MIVSADDPMYSQYMEGFSNKTAVSYDGQYNNNTQPQPPRDPIWTRTHCLQPPHTDTKIRIISYRRVPKINFIRGKQFWSGSMDEVEQIFGNSGQILSDMKECDKFCRTTFPGHVQEDSYYIQEVLPPVSQQSIEQLRRLALERKAVGQQQQQQKHSGQQTHVQQLQKATTNRSSIAEHNVQQQQQHKKRKTTSTRKKNAAAASAGAAGAATGGKKKKMSAVKTTVVEQEEEEEEEEQGTDQSAAESEYEEDAAEIDDVEEGGDEGTSG